MATVIRPSASSVLNLTQARDLIILPASKHESLIRWITASINKHFAAHRGNLPMYLEGDERTLQDEAGFFELRVDGPRILEYQKGFFFVNVEINVLIQRHSDTTRLYEIQDAMGVMLKAFTNAICINRLGDGLFDDQSLVGALKLLTSIDEPIDVNYFGIIKEDTRLQQATIEGHYRMEI